MTNSRNKITIEYTVADLPMLAHALMISGNVALMSRHKAAQKRLRVLTDTVRALTPSAGFLFDDHVFFELCAALQACPDWSVTIKPACSSWRGEGYILVAIGKRQFQSCDYSFKINDQAVIELQEFLEEMAPLRTELANQNELSLQNP